MDIVRSGGEQFFLNQAKLFAGGIVNIAFNNQHLFGLSRVFYDERTQETCLSEVAFA